MNHPAVHVQLRTGRREDPHTVFLRAGFSDGSAGHRPPTVRVGTKAGAGSATLYRWQAVPDTESISMKWRAHAGDAIGELLGLEGHHTFRSGAEAAPHMRYLVERVTDPDAVCICRYCPRQPADKSTANSTAASATRDETRALALHTDLTAAPPYDLVRAFLHRRGEVVEAAGKMGFVVGSTRHRGTRTYEIRRFGGGSVQVDAARVVPAITALQQRTDKDSPDIRAAERISSLCSIHLEQKQMFVGLERIVLGDLVRIDKAGAKLLLVDDMKVVEKRPKLAGRAVTARQTGIPNNESNTLNNIKSLPPPLPGFAWELGRRLQVDIHRVLGRFHPPTMYADWVAVEQQLVEAGTAADDALFLEAAAAGLGPPQVLPMSASLKPGDRARVACTGDL
ncbi:hypothetical protein JCM8115_002746 [Rhodotorula mucilaginosa]